jgi:hypothetical protein
LGKTERAIGLKLRGKDVGKPIEKGPKAEWTQSLEASGSGWALVAGPPGPPALPWVSSHGQTGHRGQACVPPKPITAVKQSKTL